MNNRGFEKILDGEHFAYHYAVRLNTVAFERYGKDLDGKIITTEYNVFVLMPPILRLMGKFLELLKKAEDEKKQVKQYFNDHEEEVLANIAKECEDFVQELRKQGYPEAITIYKPNQSFANNNFLNYFLQNTNSILLFSVKNDDNQQIYYSYTILNDLFYLYEIFAYKVPSTNRLELKTIKTFPCHFSLCYRLIKKVQKQTIKDLDKYNVSN